MNDLITRFFNIIDNKLYARSLLIDMEPKVIENCMTSTNGWSYNSNNIITKQSGSANNWAYGYNYHGPTIKDEFINKLRKEIEIADIYEGSMMLQSLAGGTGSGLGSYLTELINDEVGGYIINTVIWPFEVGEVTLQNYNTLLTLATLTQLSDSIVVLENEKVSELCKRRMNIASPAFNDINHILAQQLAATFAPSYDNANNEIKLFDIITHLNSHPGYRLTTIKSIPQVADLSKKFTSNTWSYLSKHLYQMHLTDKYMEEGIDWGKNINSSNINKSVASYINIRGVESNLFDLSNFQHPNLYTSWNPEYLKIGHNDAIFCQNEKMASIWSTSQSIIRPLTTTFEKAEDMFLNKAFVHHYSRFGISEDAFKFKFEDISQIIVNYESI